MNGYISVNEASERFGVSPRRVQTLCEKGRIKGAEKISGVWIIPQDAKKPPDARTNRTIVSDGQLSLFDISNERSDILTFSEVCRALSVSTATGRNWIRLGKIKPIDPASKTPVFSRNAVEEILKAVQQGTKVLKSRRNKKKISGTALYNNYIANSHNINTVNEILSSDLPLLDENALRVIIANFSLQFICKTLGIDIKGNLIKEYLSGDLDVLGFSPLIADLLSGCDSTDLENERYEHIFNINLEYVPDEDCLGFVYISLRNISERKLNGAYYTPLSVVKESVQLIKETTNLNGKLILDPCCGTGNFLLYLACQGIEPEFLYGQDIDELAIQIARLNLALRFNITDEVFWREHLVCRDALGAPLQLSCDVILGNPPWGYNFTSEELVFLSKKYKCASPKKAESYDLFVERALSVLNQDGLLCFILPEAILNVKSHGTIREILLEKYRFRFVSFLGNVFSGVQCPCIIAGIINNTQPSGIKVRNGQQSFIISPNRKFTSKIFNLHVPDEIQHCIDEISGCANKTTLSGKAKFALGLVTGNNRAYLSDTPRDGYEPVLKGSNIQKYRITDNYSYVRFEPEHFQQVAPIELYRSPEKLLYRFICETLVFAYDDKRTLSLNSCNILIPEIPELKMKYVLAILNSSVSTFYCTQKYNSVKILRSHIEEIPIPVVSDYVQNEVIRIVDRIMQSSQNIENLYETLDDYIMEIYGLPPKSRNIIRESLVGKNRFLPR
ncbi:MAG: Modification methylase VspI [Firmicutes bacterium ADurb.Bin193]|nr:MAG: Modification methylase VspI [Firmicutes bacterium ADurb.Bin193]